LGAFYNLKNKQILPIHSLNVVWSHVTEQRVTKGRLVAGLVWLQDVRCSIQGITGKTISVTWHRENIYVCFCILYRIWVRAWADWNWKLIQHSMSSPFSFRVSIVTLCTTVWDKQNYLLKLSIRKNVLNWQTSWNATLQKLPVLHNRDDKIRVCSFRTLKKKLRMKLSIPAWEFL